MTEGPFAPGKWRFDTVCFAGMTERGIAAIPHHEIPEFPGYVVAATERGTSLKFQRYLSFILS